VGTTRHSEQNHNSKEKESELELKEYSMLTSRKALAEESLSSAQLVF
jgi:hypothetical protein